MYTQTNAPESASFTKEDNQVFEAARVAAESLAKTFELWITIARAVELAKAKANKIGTRQAFERILNQQGLAPALGNTWNSQKSTASKLLQILAHLPEVEQWRASLSKHQRIHWSAPTTVFSHCPVFGNKPDRSDNAELAKLDKLGDPFKERSGIDWNPKDEVDLRMALAQAAVEHQKVTTENAKLTAEATDLRTRLGAMAMINRHSTGAHEGVSSETPSANPYFTALQAENEALRADAEGRDDAVRYAESLRALLSRVLDEIGGDLTDELRDAIEKALES